MRHDEPTARSAAEAPRDRASRLKRSRTPRAPIAPPGPVAPPPAVARTHVSVREFGRQIGVSYRTIWTWIASGRLEVVRLTPRTTCIADAEVDRFLAQGGRR